MMQSPKSPINEKPRFDGKNMVSWRFSLKPIQGIWLDVFLIFFMFFCVWRCDCCKTFIYSKKFYILHLIKLPVV